MPQATDFPQTRQTLYLLAVQVRDVWVIAAQSGTYPGAQQTGYVHGLQQPRSIRYPDRGDALAARVVNVAASASQVEEGTPSIHLPTAIRWGQTPKGRLSKQGVWYIRVPLSHPTPGARGASMASQVYRVARTLQPGQRLTQGPNRGQAIHAAGLTERQEGLQRNAGQGGRGSYFTIRTLSQRSPGWTLPARPGTHIAAAVTQQMQPVLITQLTEAVARDLASVVVPQGRRA